MKFTVCLAFLLLSALTVSAQQSQCQLSTEHLPALFDNARLGMTTDQVNASLNSHFSSSDLKHELSPNPAGILSYGDTMNFPDLGERSITLHNAAQTAELRFFKDELYQISIMPQSTSNADFDLNSVSSLISADQSLPKQWQAESDKAILRCQNFRAEIINNSGFPKLIFTNTQTENWIRVLAERKQFRQYENRHHRTPRF